MVFRHSHWALSLTVQTPRTKLTAKPDIASLSEVTNMIWQLFHERCHSLPLADLRSVTPTAFLVIFSFCAAVHADSITRRNGTVMHGQVLGTVTEGDQTVRFKIPGRPAFDFEAEPGMRLETTQGIFLAYRGRWYSSTKATELRNADQRERSQRREELTAEKWKSTGKFGVLRIRNDCSVPVQVSVNTIVDRTGYEKRIESSWTVNQHATVELGSAQHLVCCKAAGTISYKGYVADWSAANQENTRHQFNVALTDSDLSHEARQCIHEVNRQRVVQFVNTTNQSANLTVTRIRSDTGERLVSPWRWEHTLAPGQSVVPTVHGTQIKTSEIYYTVANDRGKMSWRRVRAPQGSSSFAIAVVEADLREDEFDYVVGTNEEVGADIAFWVRSDGEVKGTFIAMQDVAIGGISGSYDNLTQQFNLLFEGYNEAGASFFKDLPIGHQEGVSVKETAVGEIVRTNSEPCLVLRGAIGSNVYERKYRVVYHDRIAASSFDSPGGRFYALWLESNKYRVRPDDLLMDLFTEAMGFYDRYDLAIVGTIESKRSGDEYIVRVDSAYEYQGVASLKGVQVKERVLAERLSKLTGRTFTKHLGDFLLVDDKFLPQRALTQELQKTSNINLLFARGLATAAPAIETAMDKAFEFAFEQSDDTVVKHHDLPHTASSGDTVDKPILHHQQPQTISVSARLFASDSAGDTVLRNSPVILEKHDTVLTPSVKTRTSYNPSEWVRIAELRTDDLGYIRFELKDRHTLFQLRHQDRVYQFYRHEAQALSTKKVILESVR